ncbi:YybH family protein [Aquirufa sp. ROCK-SH2]
MHKIFYILLFILLSTVSFAQRSKDQKAIRNVLFTQQNLWNEGKIADFMEFYQKSDDLKFIGKNGITKGWKATLERYLKTYPNKEAMGQLTFDILEVDVINGKTAWVLGKWTLQRPQLGNLGGHFTLLMKKINGKWLILRDHTS